MNPRVNRFNVVGRSLPGVDSRAKLTGAANYTIDLKLPDMLHGKILRSPHAHAKIRAIDVGAALAIPGVVAVATGADLDGLDPTYGMYIRDQPVLARGKVRYVGDPVAAVAASSEAIAYRALSEIRVDYEPLPSLMTMEAALAPDAPPLFDTRHDAELSHAGPGVSWLQEPAPNILFEYCHRVGDADDALERCAHVFEDRLTFARLSHYSLEPHVTLAAVAGERVEVWSNNQDPFLLRRDIARIFKLPLESVRFHAGIVGGGFGSKSYCKIEPIAVLLAWKAGRPVRLALAMDESMLTVCEHAADIVLRTGVSERGETVARDVTVLLDGGAYADASPSVAARIGGRFGGPYRWQAVQAKVTVVRTNTVPAGSFRGFGAGHVAWASESQIDMIARRIGLDPVEFRLRNFVSPGERPVPGEAALDCDLHAGLKAVVSRIHDRARERRPGRGIGLAVAIKSSGAGHRSDASARIVGSGRVLIASGVTEIGQATRTAMVQIVAEVLGVSPEVIATLDTDTDNTPYDTGTHASTGVTVAGLAMRQAAENARASVLGFAATALGCAAGELTWDGFGVTRAEERHELADLLRRTQLSPDTEFRGEGSTETPNRSIFWMPSWTAVEVDVDAETGAVSVTDLVTAVEVGTAINPERCRSQAEGGVVQGLGQALFESLDYSGDLPANAEPLRYRVPRLRDLPARFETIVLEQGLGPGPFGAKGVGEAGNLTIPAAIANAVADAVGARVTDLPITPEKVLAAIDRLGSAGQRADFLFTNSSE
jgi:CO/xanthine dehydrogenase Mo-binding subunit